MSDELVAIEQIKQLKARYFRTMDARDWAAMRKVFTDDVVMDSTDSGGTRIEGADEFMTFLPDVLAGAVTVHHGHMPEITITSPTTATGWWALEDTIRWPDGTTLHGFGHYQETYRRLDDGWRIASSTLTRLLVDLVAGTGKGDA